MLKPTTSGRAQTICTVVILAVLLLSGCSSEDSPPAAAAGADAASSHHAQIGSWGFDVAGMDKTVKAGDEFFMFANGSWFKAIEIPAERASIGTFQNLNILSEKRLIEIAVSLDAQQENARSVDDRKLRDLYDSFLDQAQIDSRGLEPARKDLDYFLGLKTLEDVAAAMGSQRLRAYGIFDLYFDVDDKNTGRYVVYVTQSGLGLPDRDYYLRDDKELAASREAYKKYLAGMFTLAGMDDAAGRAAQVYEVEKKIAQAQWPNAERRDVEKTYNPMPISEVEKLAPQFPWQVFLTASNIPLTASAGERQVIVKERSAFPKLAAIFATTPVAVWRDYLAVHYLHVHAPYLPKNIDDADFAFYGTTLQGNSKQLDRNIRAARFVDRSMGEALGRLYVAKYFPPEAKAKAEVLVQNLLKAFESEIQTLDWMTPATRDKALEKLHRFSVKIGYPDHWRDYSTLAVSRDDLVGNYQRAGEFEWYRQVKRIDSPVDRAEWYMTPPTVNAYNSFELNEVVFPAAILQPPFFDPNADDAVNYGGIGAVIGHEISHGFDDQGSKFDASGTLNSWWTSEDRKQFDSRTAMLGKQFDAFEPLPGLHVKGALTMGENIGDLAGLTIAMKAYQIALGGKPAPILDGFTGDERFYLGFAQIWRSKYRDGLMRQLALSDEHSPSHFRVIGTTRNLDSWYSAFGVKPGEKYYLAPEARVRLW